MPFPELKGISFKLAVAPDPSKVRLSIAIVSSLELLSRTLLFSTRLFLEERRSNVT
jgi:hypothetical protein